MNLHLTALASRFLVVLLAPDGREEADHTGVEMVSAEQVSDFIDEDGRLPVGREAGCSLAGSHFVLCHLVHETLARTAIAGNLDTGDALNESLGDAHSGGLLQSRLAH